MKKDLNIAQDDIDKKKEEPYGFVNGDLVTITSGRYVNSVGIIDDKHIELCVELIRVTIFSDDFESIITVTIIPMSNLKKINNFVDFSAKTGVDSSGSETSIGDSVKIMDGKYAGLQGKAVEFLGKVMTKVEVDDASDGPVRTACFNSWLLKITKETDTGLEKETSIGKGMRQLLGDDSPQLADFVKPKQKAKKTKSNVTAIKQEDPVTFTPDTDHHGVELMNIELRKIIASPTNPRKIFDENSLNELASSIKEKGVVQPIVVRRSEKYADTFEVVCGERRFRASKISEQETIPAIVRVLTDEEALDLQIIENLQRKDVHPMEEAAAFKVLSENNGISIQDIALKVGKSDSYVAKRLKLNDLIPEIQDMFYANKVSLSLALKISRTTDDTQRFLIEDYDDWKEQEDFNLDNTNIDYVLVRKEEDLNDAPFDIEDTNIKPEMGACTTCLYNSSNQPLLFGDEKSICSNPACFASKILLNLDLQIDRSVSTDVVFLNDNHNSLDKAEKSRIKDLGNLGISVLNLWDDYSTVFNGEKGPYIKKGLIITSSNQEKIGTYKYVRLKDRSLSKTDGGGTVRQAKEDILSKEKRAKELDLCKNINAVINGIKSVDVEKFSDNKMQLSTAERIAITYALYHNCHYNFGPWLRSQVGVKKDYADGNEVFFAIKQKFESLSCALLGNDQQIFMDLIIRKYLMSYITGTTEFNYNPLRSGPGLTIDLLATEWYGKEYESIKDKQREVAEKRAKRVEQKLKQLDDEEKG